MRILFLTNELGTGGAEKLTVGYALGMAARGHHVGVAYSWRDSQAGPLREARIELFPLHEGGLWPSTLVPWTRRLKRVLASFRADVIHAQSVTSALAARLAAPRVPLLVTIHGISKSNEPVASVLLRAANVHLTAVSEVAAAGLLRHPWAPHVDILGPGIDIEQIARQADVPNPPELLGSPSLVCIARQDRVKGVDVLVQALPVVAEAFPKVGLTVVGDGLELAANRALGASLGVGDRIRFDGLIPFAAPHIKRADVVVLPSRREGLPVVALEALGLERPVVATDVGGTSTAVVDGQTGWLVPPEEPQALAEAIVACLSDRVEANRRAGAGRELVARRFASGPMLDRVEQFLQELTATRTGVPPAKPRLYHRAVRAHQSARITAWRAKSAHRDWSGVRIFGYHRVSNDDDVFAVTPDAFRGQMKLLGESGVTVLPLREALDLLASPVAGRFVCVTFDDGYRDNLEHAVPILEEVGLPGTIYVISDVLEGTATFDWYSVPPPHLTVEDLPRLFESGLIDIQAHSRTHRRLTLLDDNDLRREVAGSKERLEQYVPGLTSFSYPAGIYGAREVGAVLAAGFRAGVSTAPGVNAGGAPLGELHRTMIYWGDDVRAFDAKLGGALDVPSRLSEGIRARRARPRSRHETRAPIDTSSRL
jgi:glycosyltransferase involved in cell wall biosynthesis/peptidoglycan/xylan/chitin deacetylase (PgdA/CDA1 family)